MKILKPLLLSSLVSLYGAPVWSWQLDVTADNQVIISNTSQISSENEIYLFWYNPDAANVNQQYGVWTQETGWQPNSAKPLPIAPEPFHFTQMQTTEMPYTCATQQRCFLVLAAVDPEHDPVVMSHWKQSTILPLNSAASDARLSGQAAFLSNSAYQAVGDSAATTVDSMLSTAKSGDIIGSNRPTEVENPDIFKKFGNQLLYANAADRTLQIIDVSTVSKPRLIGELALKGRVLELYRINDYYVAIQSISTLDTQRTLVTTIKLDAADPVQVVSETMLSGRFRESRRRNNLIYTVTTRTASSPYEAIQCTMPSGCETWRGLAVTALRLNNSGQFFIAAHEQVGGYAPRVAIFDDYLLLASRSAQQINHTEIQAFSLTSLGKPLRRLPLLMVSGYVPSQFHLHMRDNLLHVVYSSNSLYSGTTLAIYKVTPTLVTLQGQVHDIGSGQALSATRFTDDKAYVTTNYQQTQRLWVVDISMSTAPAMLGSVKTSGISSNQLFVNEDELLTIGYDYSSEVSGWLVNMCLFDVSQPSYPVQEDCFVPLKGQAKWTHSPASYDENALLLDWQQRYAVLPVYAYDVGKGMHLQIVTFPNQHFNDAGRVESPVRLDRVVDLNHEVFASFGYQSLLTVKWGTDTPKVLAELELGVNLWWLEAQNGALWAGGRGNKGFFRFYEYAPNQPTKPVDSWTMAQFFDRIAMDEHTAVFYQDTPLAVQTLDLEARELSPVIYLHGWYPPLPTEYRRTQPLVHDGWFYLGEQRLLPTEIQSDAPSGTANDAIVQDRWVLRSWLLSANGRIYVEYSIPGQPIGFTSQGYLITRENEYGMTRLNLLRLHYGQTQLLATQRYRCDEVRTRVIWSDAVYLHCAPYPSTTPSSATNAMPITLADTLTTHSLADSFAPVPAFPVTIKLAIERDFIEKGRWTWESQQFMYHAEANKVVVRDESAYQCEIYQLTAGYKPKQLTLLNCPWGSDSIVLGNQQAWQTRGFDGIEVVNW